jgi:hypothetical protein
MADAPNRIWVNLDDNEDGCCPTEDSLNGDGKFFCPTYATEYVRADLLESITRIKESERERDGIREVALREAAGLARILGVHPELNTFGGGPEWHQHGKRIAYAIEALIGEPK